MSEQPQQTDEQQPVIWRRRVFAIVTVVVVAAVIGRVMLKSEQPTGSDDGLRTGLMAGGDKVEREETLGDKLAKLLPYITDAGFALLLGIIAGIGTRTAIKMVVFFLVVGVIGVQFAIHKGWMDPNDLAFAGKLKDYVFYLPDDKDARDFAIDKAPAMGGFLLGFMMGLKKG